jgi:hypothetical protein
MKVKYDEVQPKPIQVTFCNVNTGEREILFSRANRFMTLNHKNK